MPIVLLDDDHAPVLTDKEALTRAYSELVDAGLPPDLPAVDEAQALDNLAKVHVKLTREHTLALAPILLVVRDHMLFSHLGFATFVEWLAQSEIDMKRSTAQGIINIWKTTLPALQAAGISPSEFAENVSISKARLLTRPIQDAEDGKAPLSTEDLKDLLTMAQTETYEELRRHIKPSGAHTTKNEETLWTQGETEPYIEFQVNRRSDGRYQVEGTFDEREMEFLDRRLRPTWVDQNGQILRFKAVA